MPRLPRFRTMFPGLSVVLLSTPCVAQPIGWLVDVQIGRAALKNRTKTARSFATLLNPNATLTCTTDDVAGFWSGNGGITFGDVGVCKVGDLDIGTVSLSANTTGSTPSWPAASEVLVTNHVGVHGGFRWVRVQTATTGA